MLINTKNNFFQLLILFYFRISLQFVQSGLEKSIGQSKWLLILFTTARQSSQPANIQQEKRTEKKTQPNSAKKLSKLRLFFSSIKRFLNYSFIQTFVLSASVFVCLDLKFSLLESVLDILIFKRVMKKLTFNNFKNVPI